jgi:hypothetical protein
MKKRLTAFIIGAAIWFGMADAARQLQMLQSEASDLVAKTSIYLFSLGREDAPELKEVKTVEPMFAYETENATTDDMEITFPPVSKRTNKNLKQEKANVKKHLISKTTVHLVAKKDVKKLIALADEIEREVHLQDYESELLSAMESEMKMIQDSRLQRQSAVGSRQSAVGSWQLAVENSKSKIENRNLPHSAFRNPQSVTAVCPTVVSPEKLKIKTIVLVPEVLKQFGE